MRCTQGQLTALEAFSNLMAAERTKNSAHGIAAAAAGRFRMEVPLFFGYLSFNHFALSETLLSSALTLRVRRDSSGMTRCV